MTLLIRAPPCFHAVAFNLLLVVALLAAQAAAFCPCPRPVGAYNDRKDWSSASCPAITSKTTAAMMYPDENNSAEPPRRKWGKSTPRSGSGSSSSSSSSQAPLRKWGKPSSNNNGGVSPARRPPPAPAEGWDQPQSEVNQPPPSRDISAARSPPPPAPPPSIPVVEGWDQPDSESNQPAEGWDQPQSEVNQAPTRDVYAYDSRSGTATTNNSREIQVLPQEEEATILEPPPPAIPKRIPTGSPECQHIQSLIHTHKLLMFMNGNQANSQCENSDTASKVLERLCGAGSVQPRTGKIRDQNLFFTVDITSGAIQQGLQEYNPDWDAAIPQLYVNGEFKGGADSMLKLFNTGVFQRLINEMEA